MDRNIIEISNILSGLSADEVNKFLSEILTPSEMNTLTKRWRILKMLNEGTSQREIAKELSVSLCKVTRGAKILKDTNSICAKIIKG